LDTVRVDRSWATIAIFASLMLHVLLVWAVLRLVIDVVPPPRFISVILVRPPPPPRPKVAAVQKPGATSPPPVPKPIPHAAPGPVTHAKPNIHVRQARPAPPVSHFGTSGAEAGLGMDLNGPSGGGGGYGSIGDFDDAVKQRIQAAKTYPPGIPYMWNECVVEYQVTVDRTGQLLSYKLYGCDDPFLDSAARAAILMASPFPVPPNFGGTQYTVFGSLVFKHH
jgi:outer membrane biosynthesis protein TonB